ncbi:cell division protein CrgA [Streptomyces sodiiphilus]|uniref:Cell division protein CrgA n=1 Tax=Streptomyces sodiiphilus TaxID=226217 RepID=A0ABN2PL63_9ACTN
MPKSRIRKKKDDVSASGRKNDAKKNDATSDKDKKKQTKIDMGSGRNWVAPLMLALFVIGLAWIVVFYVTQGSLPVDALGNWNIVVGFGFIAAGFVVSTQWK